MATAAATVRVATPEIRWHCGPTGLNEAVLSLDFLPASARSRSDGEEAQEDGPLLPAVLATGGADKEIKLWRVSGSVASDRKDTGKVEREGEGEDGGERGAGDRSDKGARGLEFVFSLTGHDRSVNCVRFSPNGVFLASASDDTSIILWSKPKSAGDDWRWDAISSLSDVARTILACGHKGDITDLAWSPDSAFLCSTSVDNRCVIWNVDKGDVVERRKDHTQYVQGVAWDPLNEFLVTEGNDRTCRVYALGSATTGKKQSRKLSCVQTIKTREFSAGGAADPVRAAGEAEASAAQPPPPPAKHRMFLDDTCPAFARRPAWTPDGNYLLAPTGTFRATASTSKSAAVHTVYAFARGDLSTPTLHLPGHDKASLAVRCSPLLYELRRGGQFVGGTDGDATSQEGSSETGGVEAPATNLFQTPYRSIFAVVTLNAVVLYDTQQAHPICTLKDMHYADLTDASWSADGQMLSVSSMDGYLSFIHFSPGFFGARVAPQKQAELNDARIRRMFAVHKKTRKKAAAKSQSAALAGAATPEQAPAEPSAASTPNVLAVRKKRAAIVANGPGGAAGGDAVNVLQVRKKRRSAPTAAAAATAPSQVVDLSGSTSDQQSQPRAEQSGTVEDPVEL